MYIYIYIYNNKQQPVLVDFTPGLQCCWPGCNLKLFAVIVIIYIYINTGGGGANNKQQTTNNKEQRTKNKQQTTNTTQQTTNNTMISGFGYIFFETLLLCILSLLY